MYDLTCVYVWCRRKREGKGKEREREGGKRESERGAYKHAKERCKNILSIFEGIKERGDYNKYRRE